MNHKGKREVNYPNSFRDALDLAEAYREIAEFWRAICRGMLPEKVGWVSDPTAPIATETSNTKP